MKILNLNTCEVVDKLNVFKTFDYDDFVFWDLNRKVSEGLVKKLERSIRQNDYTIKNPITVQKTANNKFLILDGQHRFLACQNIGLPIYYIIDDTYSVEQLLQENVNRKRWSAADVIKVNAALGCEDSARLLRDIEDYNTTTKVIGTLSQCEGVSRVFLGEKVEYTPGDSHRFIDNYKKLSEAIKHLPPTHRLATAYMNLASVDGFDYKHFKKQAKLHGSKFIKKGMDAGEAFINMVRLYNHRCTVNKLVVKVEID